MKWSMSIKRLILPFIRHEFNEFMEKLQYLKLFNILAIKIKNYYKNKIWKKLLKYCAVVDFWKNIIIPGGIRLQHLILKKCFKKIKK